MLKARTWNYILGSLVVLLLLINYASDNSEYRLYYPDHSHQLIIDTITPEGVILYRELTKEEYNKIMNAPIPKYTGAVVKEE